MELIKISFIGIILLLRAHQGPNPVPYTALIPSSTGGISMCGEHIEEHHAYVRYIGDPESGTTWPAEACTAAPKCQLFEILNEDLEITKVTESNVGVTEMPSFGKIIKLRQYFKSISA